jgi:hypothetical protein
MKAKSSQTRKKPVVRKQTGKVHMSASATGLTSQAGLIPRLSHKNFTCLSIDSRVATESAKFSLAA